MDLLRTLVVQHSEEAGLEHELAVVEFVVEEVQRRRSYAQESVYCLLSWQQSPELGLHGQVVDEKVAHPG